MSVVSGEISTSNASQRLPLVALAELPRPLFWHHGQAIDSRQFLSDVAQIQAWLPTGVPILNLCESRYEFVVSFAAVAANGQCNLLPASRAPRAVSDLLRAHPYSVAVCGTNDITPNTACRQLPGFQATQTTIVPDIAANQCVAIGYTSGSTGQPTAHRKTWGQLLASNLRNHGVLSNLLGDRYQIIATVPPQHMYGLEMSVMLPLGGQVSIACERPFFAADVVACIETLPSPRVLVTTPLHLRALLDSAITIPSLDAIVCATAPLPHALACSAEERVGAAVIELFGSTETCVFAHRRPAREQAWTLYEGVTAHAQPDGTRISAPWLPDDVLLADLIDQPDARHFHLRGRSADLLEIAGKRASLSDINRRLLAIPGVEDAAVLQLDGCHARSAQRLAALVVAPELSDQQILNRLREEVDPVFLPRPLHRVERLPRNAIGKLPRATLLAMLEDLGA